MKIPKKPLLTLAAITTLFGAGGCDLNSNQNVYGPPPEDYAADRPAVSQFDPSQNINEDVYGPPPDLGEAEAEPELTFEVADNIPMTVYGPPSWFSGEATGESTSQETSETSEASETADTKEE